MDLNVPRYEFVEGESFTLAKAVLGVDPGGFDDHLFAIQDAILSDPYQEPWSVPLRASPDVRVAVSDATDHSPTALRVLFTVRGSKIILLHVARR